MLISDFAIRKPVITTVVMLALALGGLVSMAMLQTDEFPEVAPPIVSVFIPYPGASPENVEREVVEPIEEGISGISGLKKINSSALDGFATIVVEFDFEKDLQQATQEIRDEISEIRNDLPPEMEEPILRRFDPNELPIFTLAVSSKTMTVPELTLLADPAMTRRLRGIAGVAQVDVVGGNERELVVELRPHDLQANGVGVNQVVAALQAQNLASPVGRLTGKLEESTIRLTGRLDKPADFTQLIVTQTKGRVVRLGDVANIRDGVEEPRTWANFNGDPAVGIQIIKSNGYSTTEVADRVRKEVEDIRASLPNGVVLSTVQDAGVRVDHSVFDVKSALVEGAFLTVVVVFLFLNSWRSTIITGLALPVSVLASFIAVLAFGFTLNTMSLMGLSLAIGILIDDAIVVRENIVRHVEQGKDHYTASQEGTDEIGLAVAATTFSIVVVFVPVAFMGGIAEQWFAPMALTIAMSVLVSLFVSFSLDPMLSAYWPDPHIPEHKKKWITRVLDRFNLWFDRQAERYKRVIGWALDHRLAMIGMALGTFVIALALPPLGIVGGEFLPISDNSEFLVNLETPPGANLDYMKLKADEVARIARETPEVAYTFITVGGETGAVDEGIVFVRLTAKTQRDRTQLEIQNELREKLARVAGVTISIGNGNFENQKQIQLELRGPDSRELTRIATDLAAEVKKVPGAVDVGLSTKGQKPEMVINVERGIAGQLGITVGQVAQALRIAFAGIDAGDWVDPIGETRDVRVRLAPEARTNLEDIQRLPIYVTVPMELARQPGEQRVLPLGQVAHVTQGMGPARIDHLNRDRVVIVQANTQNRSLNEVLRDIDSRLGAIKLPPGYRITTGGEAEDQQEVFGRILIALAVAIGLMYLVLVIQFGSFLDPIAIMISLPLSLIGVMLALVVTGSTLNLMSLIGVILLMGIVAKNAILLIDFAKWSHEAGMPLREALIEAGRVRLRPILMTTFALIAGMMPIALGAGEGADFRAPLGRAVIGGVITSTLLTLLVIPTVYEIMAEWRDWFLHRFRKQSPRSAEHELMRVGD